MEGPTSKVIVFMRVNLLESYFYVGSQHVTNTVVVGPRNTIGNGSRQEGIGVQPRCVICEMCILHVYRPLYSPCITTQHQALYTPMYSL